MFAENYLKQKNNKLILNAIENMYNWFWVQYSYFFLEVSILVLCFIKCKKKEVYISEIRERKKELVESNNDVLLIIFLEQILFNYTLTQICKHLNYVIKCQSALHSTWLEFIRQFKNTLFSLFYMWIKWELLSTIKQSCTGFW